MFIASVGKKPAPSFAPNYATAREIIYTLRDDLDPKRNFFGQLDLTGAQQVSKLHHEAPNQLGLTVQYYRDEWLGLKTKLYDGNMLRLSAVERVKVRVGFHKRSRSGKQKWKPPKVATGQELKVRISVNPQVYELSFRPSARVGAAVGAYAITALNASNGIVEIVANTPATAVQSADVLGVLRLAYDMLKRKDAV
jgi:hypothetical protein